MLAHHVGRRVLSRLRARYVLREIEGFLMLLDLTDRQGCSKIILKQGRFDAFASEIVRRNLRPGSSVIDIGANIGYWTLLTSGLTTGKVYAVEPEPANFRLLEENVRINARANVVTIPKAASDRAATARLYLSSTNSGDHRLYSEDGEAGRRHVDVPTVSLDEELGVVADLGLIKIDVQGFELPAMRGLVRNLERNRDVLVLSEYWPDGMRRAGYEARAHLELMQGLGFRWRRLDTESRRLVEATAASLEDLCSDDRYVDLLFFRNEPV
jgi:FkbM family methyltransferase